MSDAQGPRFGRPSGIVAVLDTSVLIRAWLSPGVPPNPARQVVLLAGTVYDSFTSPAILDEVTAVLASPRFRASPAHVLLWLDAFLRASRQVFPELIPGESAAAVRGDVADVPILKTAYAASAAGAEFGDVLVTARQDGGWFLVSENTRHFTPGWTVHGWQFMTTQPFLRILHGRGNPPA